MCVCRAGSVPTKLSTTVWLKLVPWQCQKVKDVALVILSGMLNGRADCVGDATLAAVKQHLQQRNTAGGKCAALNA